MKDIRQMDQIYKSGKKLIREGILLIVLALAVSAFMFSIYYSEGSILFFIMSCIAFSGGVFMATTLPKLIKSNKILGVYTKYIPLLKTLAARIDELKRNSRPSDQEEQKFKATYEEMICKLQECGEQL